jgi:hypothetical protein
MQTPNLDQEATRPRRSRRMVMLGAGALALALAIIGTAAAVGGRSSTGTLAHEPVALVASPATIAEAPQSPDETASKPAGTSVSTTSTPAAAVLADGIYPTYVTKVDVDGTMVTIDVIQVFENEAASKAALEDGMNRDIAEYLYIYVRNQNPLLRTLPVAGDVRVDFLGTCESSGNRDAALTELAKKTKHFDSTFYYDVTVTDGAIHQITQRVATAAC